METKAKCVMCGKEFIVWDFKNPQKTCGNKVCDVNLKYQKAHWDPKTDYKPDPKDINKL